MSRNLSMLRIGLILVIIATILMGTPVRAEGEAVVRVEPATLQAKVNDSFDLSIKAENITGLTGFEVHLSFDPNVLEVSAVADGGFVAPDFVTQNTFDNTAGVIDYAVAQMGRPPAQGSGVLLTLSFRAKANGASALNLRATATAPTGLLLTGENDAVIQAAWAAGNVNVSEPATHTATPTGTATSTSTPTPTVTATNTPVTPVASTATTTATPTPTVTATPTTPPCQTSNCGTTLGLHTVQWGEYLYCIGRAYGVSPWAIAKTNGIWWPYLIFPGQKLSIPNAPWLNMVAGKVCTRQFTLPGPTPVVTPTPTTYTPTPVTPSPTPNPSTCRAYYSVLPGDTLYSLGKRYGVSYYDIARANGISSPWLIYAGQQLCIP